MNKKWQRSGSNYFLVEASEEVDFLEPAVYKLEESMQGPYLTKVQEKYEFPYKIYGVESDFINRVKKTYDNTTGNLGVLLNGVKGTGKTVTAKQICNNLGLPVILITHVIGGIPSYLNEIEQDIVVFVDEYEKVYDGRDNSVLSIMDGSLDNGHRKVFLLTTNELNVNINMIQRPGRVRYLKTFGQLTAPVINEIVDDILIHPELKDETIDFIKKLELITVDIIKALIQEVNIHYEAPAKFASYFNVKTLNSKYSVYLVEPGTLKMSPIAFSTEISPTKFTQEEVNKEEGDFWVRGHGTIGKIEKVIDENTIQVSVDVWEDNGNMKTELRTYAVAEVQQYHVAYNYGY